jgi:hypothetical protein
VTKSERIEYIGASLGAGQTLAEIGRALGITRERVRQIAADFGWKRVPLPKPPKAPKPDARTGVRVFADIRNACLAQGLSDPYVKYSVHRNGAAGRGIEFKLTFMEWWALWEPHWAERGRDRGKKVMCRYHDRGAYELGNVRVDYNRSNAQERSLVKSLYTPTTWRKRMSGRNRAIMDDLMNVGNRQAKVQQDDECLS